MTEERKTVLEAVAKLGLAEKKFAAKIKDFEEVANVSGMNAHCIAVHIQGSSNRRAPGLVNFVPAVAYHFCLN